MALIDRARDIAQRARAGVSAALAYSPPAVKGAGLPAMVPFQPPDEGQRRIIGSKDALFGATTYYAGPTLTPYSTYIASGLNPQTIAAVFQQCRASGIMLLKADLDEQIDMRDAHLRATDRAVRVDVTGKPFRVRPFDSSDLAGAVAKYMQAATDQIDSFDGGCFELLQANASGCKTVEKIHKPGVKVRFSLDGKRFLTVEGPHPVALVGIHNKHLNFDVATDQPRLDMGGRMVVVRPPETQPRDEFDYDQFKYIYHVTAGDGQARLRGYIYPVAPLHMIKMQAIARWAALLDIWGLNPPIGEIPEDHFQDPVKKATWISIIRSFGQGAGIIKTSDLQITPGPAPPNLDARGMHCSLWGTVNVEISKVVQGETLTTELGGTGSYNAGSVHENTKEALVAQHALDLANTIRTWLFRSILLLNLNELCAQLNSAGLRCTPSEIMAVVPRPYWVISRSMTPQVQMDLAVKAVNDLKLKLDGDWLCDSLGFVQAATPQAAVPGEPEILKEGDKAVAASEAAEGAEGNPKEPPSAPSAAPPPTTKES